MTYKIYFLSGVVSLLMLWIPFLLPKDTARDKVRYCSDEYLACKHQAEHQDEEYICYVEAKVCLLQAYASNQENTND